MARQAESVSHRSTSDSRGVCWRGRSGRSYCLDQLDLAQFSLNVDDLYLVAKGAHVLWVGSSEELVVDAQSRARFRLALDCADRAFRVRSCESAAARLTTIWDLEGAEPESARHAA